MLRLEKARLELQKLKADLLFNDWHSSEELEAIETLSKALALLKIAQVQFALLDGDKFGVVDNMSEPLPKVPNRPPVSVKP